MSMADDPLPKAKLRTMQIIAAALMIGIMVFLFFALYLVLVKSEGQPLRPADELPAVTLIAVALLLVDGSLAFVIPRVQTERAVKRIAAGSRTPPRGPHGMPVHSAESFGTDADKLLLIKQSSMLTGLALLEGAAFCAVFGYMLEGHFLALVVVAIVVLLMLALFPTESRVRAWLDRNLQRIADLRAEQGGVAG
jgi:hypothetical protein